MPDLPFAIRLSYPSLDAAGLAMLGQRWGALERLADASPFQGWAWIGSAAARFGDPVLIAAEDAAGPLGLALWNRRRSWLRGDSLFLQQSGIPAEDAAFTEHNDPLLARRAPPGVLAAMLWAAASLPGGPRLVLPGVSAATAAAAGALGLVAVPGPDRAAPFADLLAPQDKLSRNTRQQLHRSNRAYAACGPLRIERAASVAEAHGFLDALIVLHEATWRSRGKPGAFASPAVMRFHRALVAAGAPDRVELLRVRAGPSVVGYLYNLVAGGWACAYQSGFDYPGAPPHGKPGLTSHALAMAAHRDRGGATYDFLAGPDRYKRSLATGERMLHWLAVAPARHPVALMHRVRRLVGK